MDDVCSVSDFRIQMELAHQFTKSRIPFVVVPVLSREEFVKFVTDAALRLEKLANEAERN